jgi:ABC-type transport system involved in cytochrome bd biosynthesis fused ATPase/permease subunit
MHSTPHDTTSVSPTGAALVAEGLVKTYRDRTVLDGISLTAAPGRRIGLIGKRVGHVGSRTPTPRTWPTRLRHGVTVEP